MKLALAVIGSSLVLAGCATSPKPEDHAAHQTPGATTAGPAAPAPGHMDAMKKSMHEMHDKMKAAKTPEERDRLMQEHKKLMQDGMAMMRQMRGGKGGMGMGGGKAMDLETMGQRIDMMEMMMQMMMDREGMKPPGAK